MRKLRSDDSPALTLTSLRFLTIRVDELEEGPSVQMRKQDRERRGRREREMD